ncbi:Calcineurin-like phosphoesterase (plasmid) [Neorhizobium galegae bv. officinalis bv. officinalis str. HAMBI 1141]|uniref:Calcineurin-like phosphoesterase n=1 Tax=Neorhizobium galegae bv. officinalis bv. officinalis str. HAMBI 1141 TaxID=1028801 RepID=A0A068TIH1_NEOGA|nr:MULTISPECIES: metallophosphoesterase [Neorhizobium]MCJ9672250.1 metallophosphoesterase [Neorhizobium sp. SHOUNA12B]MCJ9748094.1 metallophosphoesterase [Neorhizobium sp. SHOUNA12A]MCJ9751241.1 metallophosphoesterase [Neorhizobium sp. BETTINA12A]CDN58168.1 Calcineurin-like phosphoesterase [Neorhizobium galegae bv. officinalis bv. officinalis str. HAMBI 1141]
MPKLPSIAIIADAHFHDVKAGFDFPGITIEGDRMALRTWVDTRQSTRVFNESTQALFAALDEVKRREIRHVVLLGDYSDDGQRETLASLRKILTRHVRENGTNFYALPGNHDIFGPAGRHHTKEFVGQNADAVQVTSDSQNMAPGTIFSAGMFCEGYPAGLDAMAEFGYFRQLHYLHWETPFGASDAIEARRYDAVSPDGRNHYHLMDASYLVEPEDGLWLLMIDANVFEPRDGSYVAGEEAAFVDSTAAGWNALLRCKPFIIDWIADVSSRAKALGKTLLAFSHYPALDPFDGATAAERVLFGETNVARRTPRAAVADGLLDAGLVVHFSGHLHVEGITRRSRGEREIVNIAVPSIVAYPAAFKVARLSPDSIEVETVELSGLTLDQNIFAAYRQESNRSGTSQDAAFDTKNYGAYLRAHKEALIHHRYFPKEWPEDVVDAVSDLNLLEVCRIIDGKAPADDGLAAIGIIDAIVDWYCLRQAAVLALGDVTAQRRDVYRKLAQSYGRDPAQGSDGTVETFLAIFLGAFADFLDRAERGAKSFEISLKQEFETTC